MNRIDELAGKFYTFFFSWGYFYFSAGYFCCKQNIQTPIGIYV
ncbi:hypothetical protein [Cellulosilyticum sp. I15G10I2]|nr:hypothetical protein [Cellulosilyticum sp. I15G10I2]